MRHCHLRIMRTASKPLIVAAAVGKDLNPRVGLMIRFNPPWSDSQPANLATSASEYSALT
jgi:hypothetical protein